MFTPHLVIVTAVTSSVTYTVSCGIIIVQSSQICDCVMVYVTAIFTSFTLSLCYIT
jgi:hypothetical protein